MGFGFLGSGGSKSSSSTTVTTTTQTSSGVFDVTGGLGDTTVVQYGNGVNVTGLSDENLKYYTDATTNFVDQAYNALDTTTGTIADLSKKIINYAENTGDTVFDFASETVDKTIDSLDRAFKNQQNTTVEAMEQVATAWGRANNDTQTAIDSLKPFMTGVFLLGGVAIVAALAAFTFKR